jgi:hypothetical protein
LQTLRQGSKSCVESIRTAKSLSDQPAIVGNITIDDDLISYIIEGLNPTYNAFVMTFSMLTKDKSMTSEDFQSQLLGYEQFLEHQATTTKHTSFAMFSQRTLAKPKYNSNFKKSSNPGSFNRNFQSNPPKRPYFPFADSSQGRSYSGPPSNFTRASPFNHGSLNKIICQICGRVNYQALDCFHQMDYAFQGCHPPSDLAAMVA